jgi:hypothetical protein
MQLDLTEEQAAALLRELNRIIDNDPISAFVADSVVAANPSEAAANTGGTGSRADNPQPPAKIAALIPFPAPG